MGNKQSSLLPDDEIEEYCALTYFDRKEIIRLFDVFLRVNPQQVRIDRFTRLPANLVMESVPVLKHNPLRERLVRAFSSQRDDCFSFDDLVDLASAFHEKSPAHVRAAFAFRLYDFNDDGFLTAGDLARLVDFITNADGQGLLDEDDLETVVAKIMEEAAIEGSGTVNELEFQQLIKKIPDFDTSFKFHL